MTIKNVNSLKIDEALACKVKLISAADRETIAESVERSHNRLGLILASLNESRIDEESLNHLHEEMHKEACKLERLMILEGTADKNFFEIQKNFRSMVRAANVLIKWFPKTMMSNKMSHLRTEGIALLSGLYEHIKQLEAGADQEAAGVALDSEMAAQRDKFMKVFTDFAVLFRGMMSVADVFSEDPALVGGHSEIQGIFASLENDFMLTDEPLGKALAIYDEGSGKRNAMAGKTGIPDQKKGLMGKLFGGKSGGLTAKFQHEIVKTIQTQSPGFSRIIPVQDVVNALMNRSLDQLRAYFSTFNSYVAADVDVNFLLNVSKNPRTIGSMFKSVWDSLSAGHMKTMH